jgi:hypothetical protein
VVAHSKDVKKNDVIKKKISTQVDDSSKPSPSSPLENEMSQTKPKVSTDFERVFSKVIGSQNPSTSRPMDYSETYQRAFGGTTGKKDTLPPKQKELSNKSVAEAKPTPNTIATEKGRKEGLSTSYMTVFGRLVRDEDRDGTGAEIRESLKKSMGSAEVTKIMPEATPSGTSVFERFSHSDSASKDKDSRVAKIQETAQNEEIKITPGEKPAQSGKSVFERLSHSNS